MEHNSDIETNGYEINIEKLFTGKLDLDKSIYRNRVKHKERYNWRIVYKYSDLLVSCNKDVSLRLEKLIKEIYGFLESCIEKEPVFEKSLVPLEIKEYYPPIIKRMCRKTAIFNVGPMAAVAGVLVSMCYPDSAVMGQEYLTVAIIVVVLGGLGSIPGSFIGGFVLGIIGSIVAFYDPGLTMVAYYAIFILLLLIRPKGIMGK